MPPVDPPVDAILSFSFFDAKRFAASGRRSAIVFMESSHVLFSVVKFKKEDDATCSTNSLVFIPLSVHITLSSFETNSMINDFIKTEQLNVCFVAFNSYVFMLILNAFCVISMSNN